MKKRAKVGDCAANLSPAAPVATTSIAALSDKELLFIFTRQTTPHLLQSVTRVCLRWRWLGLKALADRRSLTLLQSDTWRKCLDSITERWFFDDHEPLSLVSSVPLEQRSVRISRPMTTDDVQQVLEHFPNLTHLTLYGVDHLSVEAFVQLIAGYPDLENLDLHCTEHQQKCYRQSAHFWTRLSSLNRLTYLALPFDLPQASHITVDQLLPLFRLPSLRCFYLSYLIIPMTELLGTLPPEDIQPVPITFLYKYPYAEFGHMFMRLSGCMDVDKDHDPVTRLGLYVDNEFSRQVPNLTDILLTSQNVTRLANVLTHLDLSLPCNVNLLSVLPRLVILKRLTHLRLTYPPVDDHNNNQLHYGLNTRNYRNAIDQPLHSVRSVYLKGFPVAPSVSTLLYCSVICPDTEALHFEDCRLPTIGRRVVSPRWLLSTFHRFARLTKVYWNAILALDLDRTLDADKVETDRLRRLIKSELIEREGLW